MARGTQAAFELIDGIYAAAENPDLWDVFFGRLADSLHANLAGFVFEDFTRHRASVAGGAHFDPSIQKRYESYYSARNPWLEASLPHAKTGLVVTSQMLVPDREFVKSEYYVDFLRKIDARHLLGTVVLRDKTALAQVSLLRPGRHGPFGDQDVALMKILGPHLLRALRLHQRIVDLECERSAVADCLDRAAFGVILLDATGKVVLCNRFARAILASGDGLSARQGELSAARHDETSALHKAIAEAIRGPRSGDEISTGFLAISRPSLRRPLSVLVSPLARPESIFKEPRAAAALFIADPEGQVETGASILERLHGLTPAEAKLAGCLMHGDSLAEASNALEITIGTARTHLKHVFEKTRTGRQGELVRLLLMSVAGAQQLL
jgi:DNA-binding CsgD family transcriptional regulator